MTCLGSGAAFRSVIALAGRMESLKSVLKSIGMRIRETRKRLRLTQEEVAECSGIALSFYSAVERGAGNPSVESLVKIANALRVSLTELLCGGELAEFAQLRDLVKGVPASMRVLTLKAFSDVAALVQETERTVKTRYEK